MAEAQAAPPPPAAPAAERRKGEDHLQVGLASGGGGGLRALVGEGQAGGGAGGASIAVLFPLPAIEAEEAKGGGSGISPPPAAGLPRLRLAELHADLLAHAEEAQLKAQRLAEEEKRLLVWIEQATETGLGHHDGDLLKALRSGEVLVRLANRIKPGIVPSCHAGVPASPAPPSRQAVLEMACLHPRYSPNLCEKIRQYVRACWELGMPTADLFAPADLYYSRHRSLVGRNLQALAQLAAALPTYAGPLPPAPFSSGRTPRRMSVVAQDAGGESAGERSARSPSSSSSSPREASGTSATRARPNAEEKEKGQNGEGEEEEEGGDPHWLARELREARKALQQLQRENAELRALRAEERQQASEAQYEEAEKKQLMKTIRLLAKERRTSQHVMNLTRFKAEMRALELEAELHQERTLRRRAETQALSPHAHHPSYDDRAPEEMAISSGGIAGASPVEDHPGGHSPDGKARLGGGGNSATEDLARRLERELAQERQEKHELRQLYGKRIAELEALVERLQEECKPTSAHKRQDRINNHHSTDVDDVDDEMDALHSSLEMSRAVSREHGLVCPGVEGGASHAVNPVVVQAMNHTLSRLLHSSRLVSWRDVAEFSAVLKSDLGRRQFANSLTAFVRKLSVTCLSKPSFDLLVNICRTTTEEMHRASPTCQEWVTASELMRVAERVCYREQKKKGRAVEVHLLHFLKASPVWCSRALWEANFWETLARLQQQELATAAGDASEPSHTRSRSESEAAGRGGGAEKAQQVAGSNKIMSKERSARTMLGIFGMMSKQNDKLADRISRNDSAKPASRDDEPASRELAPLKDLRKKLHDQREEWEVSGDMAILSSLGDKDARVEQGLFVAALQRVGEQMVDWDLPSPFLHDALSALCRLSSLPASAYTDLLQHVHLYVDDPTRKKEEKRMLKRTKAEDDRRKKEEDKENERLQKQWKEEERRTKGLKGAEERYGGTEARGGGGDEGSSDDRGRDEHGSSSSGTSLVSGKSRGKSFRKRKDKKEEAVGSSGRAKEKALKKQHAAAAAARESPAPADDTTLPAAAAAAGGDGGDFGGSAAVATTEGGGPGDDGVGGILKLSGNSRKVRKGGDKKPLSGGTKITFAPRVETATSTSTTSTTPTNQQQQQQHRRHHDHLDPEQTPADGSGAIGGSQKNIGEPTTAQIDSLGQHASKEDDDDDNNEEEEKEEEHAAAGAGLASQQQRKGKGHSRSRSVGTFIPSLSLNPFLRRDEDEAGGKADHGRSFPSLLSPRRIIASRDRDRELEREKEKREKELRAFLGHNLASPHDKKRPAADDGDPDDARRVFHVPLRTLLQRDGGSLPRLAADAINALRREEALTTVGIFRVTSAQSEIDDLVSLLDTGGVVDWAGMSVHTAASLLKRFLKCLPEPLLSWQLYPRFLSVASLGDPVERLRELRVLVNLLPTENKSLLDDLTRLLVDIASRAAVNKMNVTNLATVIGPTLLYAQPNSEEASDSLLGNMNAANLVVESIIAFRAELFGTPACEPNSTSVPQPTDDALTRNTLPADATGRQEVKGGGPTELPGLNETAVSRLRSVRDQWRKRETSSGERLGTKAAKDV